MYGHRLPLLCNDIAHRPLYLRSRPKIARASVIRPVSAMCGVQSRFIQSPARIRFQRTHHLFGRSISLNDRMNMICPYVRRDQSPFAALACSQQAAEHDMAPAFVKRIRRPLHDALCFLQPGRIRGQRGRPRHIMKAVHCPFLAVQMRSVTNKSDQVCRRSHSLPLGVPFGHMK